MGNYFQEILRRFRLSSLYKYFPTLLLLLFQSYTYFDTNEMRRMMNYFVWNGEKKMKSERLLRDNLGERRQNSFPVN